MSERVAICTSSADIPMESVEECRHVGFAVNSMQPFSPKSYPAWAASPMTAQRWNDGEFEIFSFVPGYTPKVEPVCKDWCGSTQQPANGFFAYDHVYYCSKACLNKAFEGPKVEPSPVVAEKPIDWTRFLSADFVGEDINNKGAPGYRLPAGTVFLSRDIEGSSVREIVDPRRDLGIVALAGYILWDSTNCRVIRHPNGTWAPGYGPDGPIEAASSLPRLNMAKWVDEIVKEMLASYRLPKPTAWAPPVILAADISPSLVAAIPDLPRDHRAPLKHLVPRWSTPRYEAPGRWRK